MTMPTEPTTPETPASQAPMEGGQPAETPAAWSPPASQADLDRIVQERLARERAKFADYDDLREKASYWDELESASQTEYEKQAEALTAAEARYQAAQQRIVTAELRAAGIPAEIVGDLDLSRFIDGDGEVDTDRINVLRDKYAALTPAPQTPRLGLNPAQGTSAQPPLTLAERVTQAEAAGDVTTAMRLKARMALNPTT